MFFKEERLYFFKPLVGKYREQIAQCLSLLYERQYSSSADYGSSLSRDQLIEVFEEALARSSNHIFEEDDGLQEQRFKSYREQGGWVLNQLIDAGWIERQVDPATLQSTFPFSRMGRIFTLSLVEADNTQIRTRHRNTRNTLNSLEAFYGRGEVYDLLDAYEYSERIITDFTDIISELEERKRELVKEVESQQLIQQATDQFFDFMEKRFKPDIAVRLSADSVEKHREDINKAIYRIKRKKREEKADAERRLRQTVPELCDAKESFLMHILDTIDQRMRNASDIMLPALRRSLHGFTRRADIIIRQLSYMNSHARNDLVEICRELSDLSDEEYGQRLVAATEFLSPMSLKFVDPGQVKLSERKQKQWVDSTIHEPGAIDKEAQRELMIQQLLDQAFMINKKQVSEYVVKSLRAGRKISTRDLPINDAKDLIAMAHVIEIGGVNHLSSDHQFLVKPTGQQVNDTPYYHSFDEFTIELVSHSGENAEPAK
ncbi:ferrochelatase [Oleiphilus sp. HI0133]|nr:ferrochelatase [Oleiphilus sp. HI0133]